MQSAARHLPADGAARTQPAAVSARGAGATPAAERSTGAQLNGVRAALEPLLHRIRLGEGGLIGMTAWAAAWQTRDPIVTVWVFAVTALLLASVYLFNDVSDRWIDAYNPKKVAHHRAPLLQYPRLFLALSILIHVVVCLLSWRMLGSFAGACAASLLFLNPFYSAFAKGVPALDVVTVGVMGGAVVGLATSDAGLLLLAAAMTAISHAFQTRVDVDADIAAGVHNSGTAPQPLRGAIWIALAIAFAVATYNRVGPVWALSAVVPYLLLSRSIAVNRAWGWVRVYFALLWIAATVR